MRETKEPTTLSLTVLLCQTKPIHKETKTNLSRWKSLLSKYSYHDNIDIVMFPEMAFTGYTFSDP